MNELIGKTISHYRILEQIGQGGMGVVYKAEDTKLDRLVALKFLPTHLIASEQDKARFIQEAKAASAINHPNICTIYSIDEERIGPGAEQQLFIVMEYVDGQTLHSLEKQDPGKSAKRGVEIGMQIADGLAAAHEKGIVHRDIKPENIMVRKDGIAQIMDFGLAKLRAPGATRLTKEGSTIGTAGYMSPEQVQGQDVDHRSDIFSLGVVLYELLTGQLPFKGVHETALLYEIVNVDPPPMASVKPDIDPELDRIVLECLDKDPNERMQSVRQVSIDLKRFKRESSRQRASRITSVRPSLPTSGGARTSPVRSNRMIRFLWPAVAFLFAVSSATMYWMMTQTPVIHPQIMRMGIGLPQEQQLEIDRYTAIAISPDGSNLAYRASGRLVLRKIDSFDAQPIAGTDGGQTPFFSPDGRWIGFFAGGKLKKVSLSGGAPVVLGDAVNNRGAVWLKDGSIVFTPAGRGGMHRIKEDGSDDQNLTIEDSLKNERTHRWPASLPDGKTVLFTVGSIDNPDYYDDAVIGTINVETGARKTIMRGGSAPRFLASGTLLYGHAGTLFAVPFDLQRLEVNGKSYPVVENIAGDPTTGALNYSFSDNGTLVYIPGESEINNRTLTFVDRKDSLIRLHVPGLPYVEPRLSPDGRHIAVAVASGKGFDIWIYDLNRTTMSRLTFGGSNRSPIWSPDGKRIAYSFNVGNRGKIIVRNADGTGSPDEINTEFDRTYVSSWTPDGLNIIASAPRSGMGFDLQAYPMTGDRKPWSFLSTKFDESYASISPDGKWIAYESNESGFPQVFIRPFPRGDGKWQVSTDGGNGSRWSPDGRTLYFVAPEGIMAVSIEGTSSSLQPGQPHLVFPHLIPLEVETGHSYDVTSDGLQVLITKPSDGVTSLRLIRLVVNWPDDVSARISGSK